MALAEILRIRKFLDDGHKIPLASLLRKCCGDMLPSFRPERFGRFESPPNGIAECVDIAGGDHKPAVIDGGRNAPDCRADRDATAEHCLAEGVGQSFAPRWLA